MRGVNPGEYRHRVRLERPVLAQDNATGEVVTTWETLTFGAALSSAVPAECLTGPGREYKGSGQTLSEVALRVRLRWFPGLDTSYRITFDGQVYDIRSAELDTTSRREWRLECRNPRKAIVGDGFITEGGDFVLAENGNDLVPE